MTAIALTAMDEYARLSALWDDLMSQHDICGADGLLCGMDEAWRAMTAEDHAAWDELMRETNSRQPM